MRRVLVFIIFCLSFNAIFLPEISHAEPSQQSSGISVTVEPSLDIQQGRVALVHVFGAGIQQVRGTFLGSSIEFYATNIGDWVGFLAVDMEATPGGQPFDISVLTEGNQVPQLLSQQLNVVWGAFDYEDIPIPFAQEALLDPILNEDDFSTLARAYDRTTPERFFTTFVQPTPGPPISGFGQIRNYNGVLRGRHTGIDFRAVTGTPITAASEGRVVYAAHLPIHGNHVVIDHGWGILSGYSHMSEILVVPGQLVRQGDTIGLVGSTGRTQGPHLHFEMAVNGYWVDPVQFLNLHIPLAAPTELVRSNQP